MAEMSAPEQIEPEDLGDYLEVMSRAVFQSGISWRVVNSKWPNLGEAVRGFDIQAVATLSEADLEGLAQDSRVIRKLAAIVHNARRIIDLDEERGGFRHYLRSHGGFDETVADLGKQFKFMGEMGCCYFLHVVGEDVPPHDEWFRAREERSQRWSQRAE